VTKLKTVLVGAALLASLGAACGSSEEGGPSGTDAGAAGGGDALSISAPEDGAEVSLPFTLEMSSADPLGAPETGDHHVHVFFDGDDSAYEVVTTDTFEITDLSPGEHTLTASLRNADHSPAGTDVTIDLTVAGGSGDSGSKDKGSGGSDKSNPGSDDTNYGY
jgi:hypothetical protein